MDKGLSLQVSSKKTRCMVGANLLLPSQTPTMRENSTGVVNKAGENLSGKMGRSMKENGSEEGSTV